MSTPVELARRGAAGVAGFFGETWPSLLALLGWALITLGVIDILGRGAGLIVAGLFLLCIVGWKPLVTLVLNGLVTVAESDDA